MKRNFPYQSLLSFTIALCLSQALSGAAELETPELPAEPAPGEYTLHVRWSPQPEVLRKLILILPDGYDPEGSHSLLYALHGGSGNARDLLDRHPDLVAGANRDNVILVFPEGGVPAGPNGFFWPIFGAANNFNDVNYFSHLTAWLTDVLAVNPERVFLSGFSNGAGLTQRLLVERPGIYAGGVAFCFSNARDYVDPAQESEALPPPSGPVPIVLVRGGQDKKVTPDGTPGKDGQIHATVAEHFQFWTAGNGCDMSAVETFHPDPGVTIRRASNCDAGVSVYMVYSELLGHRWPKKNTPGYIDGDELVLRFMRSLDPPKAPEIRNTMVLLHETLRLDVQAPEGEVLFLEASGSLQEWTPEAFREDPDAETMETDRVTATGAIQSIYVPMSGPARYYRIRTEEFWRQDQGE